ncbi:glycosyltransferase [Actinomadura rubrisoli]|uniref:Glycosyltransferase n=1 Tax=Actinomadura rubrisoli TaxID=2530368 RepID=A0A4V2YYN3_9ACTN|nr:glycosyltransferase [Actinomadura rubrisoli]TDD93867.1 glycosyltransferase [Actinomadura rubrisoli]
MTRVLHVITGLDHGGAERQLALLLRHLPVTCEVAALTGGGALAEAIRGDGVAVHEIGMRGNRDLTAVPRLARLIRRGGYDVVHTHLYRACVYGRVAARLAGTPRVIATEHSLGEGQIEGRPATRGVRALYLATERLGSVTVAVSPTVAARLRGWGVAPGRIVVIPNGIDAAAFAFDPARRARTRLRFGIAPDEWIVGAVGRLVPTKRFDLLIEAVARLDGPRLLLAGAGPERGPLERLAARLGASGRVIFAGGTEDVAGALAAMDVLAAPSTQETFGLGVLEALAAGLPVRYTACPALDDLPPGEAPNALRLPTRVDAWSTELGRLAASARGAARGPGRRERVPPVVGRYAIAEQAARLARLYLDGPDGGAERSPSAHEYIPN